MNLRAIPAMLAMIPSLFTGLRLRDLERIKVIARKAYPSVPRLGTNALAEWMEKPGSSLLLLDVRTPEEFAVSHLRNALNARTPEQVAKLMAERKPAQTVLYCAVGFRSSRLAHLLARQGLPGILNLEGSIFQWANEGRPVYRAGNPVRPVHPYGKRWAGLLKEGLAAER